MTTKTRKRFNLRDELQKALDDITTDAAESRAELEAKNDTDDRWYAQHCYTTAQDLERRVRDNLGCQWRSTRIMGLGGISLLQHCRDFLFRSGLPSHNFGRGHCSGQRFRLEGAPEPASEKRTKAAKAKEKPVHFKLSYPDGKNHVKGDTHICGVNAALKRKPSFRGRTSRGPRTTNDTANVTCPRCRKLLDAGYLDTPREVRIEEIIEDVEQRELWDDRVMPAHQELTVHLIDVETGACIHRKSGVDKKDDTLIKRTFAQARKEIKEYVDTLYVTLVK